MAKQWNFQRKMSDQQAGKQSLEKVLVEHKQLEKQNDHLVEQSLQDQSKNMMEKLRIRRENSMNKSLSKAKLSTSMEGPLFQKNIAVINKKKQRPVFASEKTKAERIIIDDLEIGDKFDSNVGILKMINETTSANPFNDGTHREGVEKQGGH